MGKAKLTSIPVHTVPRLEICAAVLVVELAEFVTSELDLRLDNIGFYSDSKVVLGYISNNARRFYVYVSNRVLWIRSFSSPEQWKYIPTDLNPADIATRSVSAAHLSTTNWLCGPSFLKQSQQTHGEECSFELVNPSSDAEIHPLVSTMKTTMLSNQLGSERVSKFFSWKSLIHAIARLSHIAHLFKKTSTIQASSCKSWHHCQTAVSVEELARAKGSITCAVQEETYAQEYACITKGEKLPKDSPLKASDPFIDADAS